MITRLFFATDIHGSEKCFLKFLNAGKVFKVDALVLGGDITGKVLTPIVPLEGGKYKVLIQDTKNVQEKVVKSRDELNEVVKSVRLNGFYPYETTPQELEEIRSSVEKLKTIFEKVMTSEIARWVGIAEERLKGTNIKCFITGGNDDPLYVEDILKRSQSIRDPEGEVVEIDGHEMVSCGLSNPTPWKTPREVSEAELAQRIDNMTSRLRNPATTIFNLHVPPYDSALDTAPKLDISVFPPRPVLSGNQCVMVPVGSRAVRAAIEKYGPLVSLHGHIHESKGAVRIGRTMCFNPGSEYSEGVLCGYLLTITDKVQYQLISG